MLEEFKNKLREFNQERDWDQFHSPKNLTMALAGEVGELIEHFQWLTEKQSGKLDADQLKEVSEEIADIQIYLIQLADRLNIDIEEAVNDKIKINQLKYPRDKAKGSAEKYHAYEQEEE
jgi:dCTP diphosphatase